jgi:hypothetical protein
MKEFAVPREYGRRRAMRWRSKSILAGLAGILVASSSSAAARTCASVVVEVDVVVRARWPELAEELREAFDRRGDVDSCARVQVTSVDGLIAVEVSLPDGRSASRPVKRREDLVPSVEALLLLPRVSDPESSSPPASSSITVARAEPVVDVRNSAVPPTIQASRSPPSSGTLPSRFRIELSIALGAHVGDGQKSAGIGAISLLDMAGWLVGFDGRADRYDGTVTAPARMDALEIGVLGGRRFRSHDLALDVVAGPALALRGGSGTAVAPVSSGSMMNTIVQSTSSEALVPRFRVSGRLTFRARSMMRTFLGVDGEVGDVGPRSPGPLNETQGLPAWTVGLAVGATVGTL